MWVVSALVPRYSALALMDIDKYKPVDTIMSSVSSVSFFLKILGLNIYKSFRLDADTFEEFGEHIQNLWLQNNK